MQLQQTSFSSPKTTPGFNALFSSFQNNTKTTHFEGTTSQVSFRPTQDAKPCCHPVKCFCSIRKLSDESTGFKEVINGRGPVLTRRRTEYLKEGDVGQISNKTTKAQDLMKQTLSVRSTQAFSAHQDSSDPQLHNLLELQLQSSFYLDKSRGYLSPQTMTPCKSFSQLISQNPFEEVQLLNQKIDRNKKLIQQLRKVSAGAIKSPLKNVHTRPTPTFINLKQEAKKRERNEIGPYMTPKNGKGTYESRFDLGDSTVKINSMSTPTSPAVFSQIPSFKQLASLPQITIPSLQTKKTSFEITKPSIEHFEIGKKLGQGKFGIVYLVQHKETLGWFAMKKINKAAIKAHRMTDQLALQIRLQSVLKHRNVLGMYGFFEEKDHFYMLLQYMEGGTLYDQVKSACLSQADTAAVVKQLAEAFQYLHDIGIAHRDLKPENVVISNGVYKICDFGWAAFCDERRKTYCGTFDYVAPEILEGSEYDMTVDLWCLGVMTFELMTGKAPFYHMSKKETKKRILNVENETINFPEDMSCQARDFIQKLVRKNPESRMQASQALLHPFLQQVPQAFQ